MLRTLYVSHRVYTPVPGSIIARVHASVLEVGKLILSPSDALGISRVLVRNAPEQSLVMRLVHEQNA
eukprot:1257319-Prymnesium_polylepis.1